MTSVTVEIESYERPPVRARAVLSASVAAGAPSSSGAVGAPATAIANPPPYRYEPADGVPPLAQYGGDVLVRFTGSTHDERALITKAPSKVAALNEHLRAKIEQHAGEIELVELDQDSGARTLFVSYGVTAGAMLEAVSRLRSAGRAVSAIVVKSLWPVPERALRTALLDVDRVVVGELNHGQYRREVERLAQGLEVRGVNRVDGELITPEQFMEAAR